MGKEGMNMEITQYDKPRNGFDVDPKQLAHDLAILKISKDNSLTEKSTTGEYYAAYIKARQDFAEEIQEKTRYDSAFNG